MKRLPSLLALVCLMLAANAAHAQTGMNLAWNNCITQSSAAEDKSYACDGSTNGTPYKIVFSFFTPVALPEFVGIEALFDVQSGEETLPDWWRLGDGECRQGVLGFPGGLTGIGTGSSGACRNPWIGAQTGGGYRWFSDSNGDTASPGNGRLRVAFARDAGSPASLVTNQQYVGGVVLLDSYRDVDPGDTLACGGCTTPVCIVLNRIQLFQNAGASGGDIQTIDSAETRSIITWQGGAPDCPGAAPQRSVMWGTIRALYR